MGSNVMKVIKKKNRPIIKLFIMTPKKQKKTQQHIEQQHKDRSINNTTPTTHNTWSEDELR